MKTAGHSGTAAQRHRQTTRLLLLAAALILGVAGCRGLGGVRPRLVPLPGSVVRTVDIPADSATRALAAALLCYFEGRFARAEKEAALAWETGAAPGLAALIAARAAHQMREYERRGQCMRFY